MVTLVATVLLVLVFSSVAFADGTEGKDRQEENGKYVPAICIQGVVIDHREHPVDGTRTDPPLVVRAVPVVMDSVLDASEPMTSTEPMTDTVPVEPTQEMTPTQEIAPTEELTPTQEIAPTEELTPTQEIAPEKGGEPLQDGYTANVDKEGRFWFKDLPEGTYDFVLQLPEGWEGIVPLAERGGIASTGATELKAIKVSKDGKYGDDDKEGKKCYPIIFKLRRVFDVIVIKWEENWDATVTPGEGWKITAEPYKDPFAEEQKQITDVNGQAAFVLTSGVWIIEEEVKEGWKPITPQAVKLVLDPYAQAGAMDPIVFKNLKPACYSKIIVRKVGYGASPEGGEVQLGPLAGWEIVLKRADGYGGAAEATTDASGTATFDGLKPGVYKVYEKVQPGWEVVGDNPLTVVHMDCETTNVVFNNREVKGKLWIYGTKWYKPAEKLTKGGLIGLSGWEITAKLLGTDQMVSTYTDGLGRYKFDEATLQQAGIGFPGATVEVCEGEREDWENVTPECVRVTFPYPVPLDFNGVKVDFVNAQLCDDYYKGKVSKDDPWYEACKGYGKEYKHDDKGKDECKDGCKDYAKEGPRCKEVYTVHRGDTLNKIAAKFHEPMYEIARANHIKNPDLIYTGQKLCIQ